MRVSNPRVWIAISAAAFLGYRGLLAYCDLISPEYPGFRLSYREGRPTVTEVRPGSPAARAGLAQGDVLRAIEGHAIADRLDVEARDENVQFGRPRDFEIERAGETRHLAVTFDRAPPGAWRTRERLLLLGNRALQLITLSLGVFIAWLRPRDPVALLGALTMAVAGVFSVTLPYRIAAVWRELPMPLGVVLWWPFFASCAIGAVGFAFFSTFPGRRSRRPVVWAAMLAPMALSVGLYGRGMLRTVYQPDNLQDLELWPGRVLLYLNVVYLLAGLVMLVRNYRAVTDANARRRVKVLVIGSLVGCLGGAPVVVWYYTGGTDLTHSLFSSRVATVGSLTFVAFPASFAYALLRHRLFDLRVMVRLGVQYALARRALLSIVPVVAGVLVLDVLIHGERPLVAILRARGGVYLMTALATFLAYSRRRAWLDALDRRFFREGYDARQLLSHLLDDVRHVGAFDAVAPRVVSQIEAALHPVFVTILSRSASSATFAVVASAPTLWEPQTLPAGMTLVQLAAVLKRPVEVSGGESTWLNAQLPADEVDIVRDMGLELIVPIVLGSGRRDALLALGVKRSEEPYSREDCDLLMAIAASLALVVERPAQQRPSAPEAFAECPSCGTLLPLESSLCPNDAAVPTPSRAPRVLAARYRLERRISRGGMGTVYAATDTALERSVAVKVLRNDLIGDPEAAARFQRETRVAARFSHPNVVTVHDAGVTEDHLGFLVMELLGGSSLRTTLDHDGRLSVERTVRIVRGIAGAIDEAHERGLIHRDLKPENIFLSGSDETPKVLDFGIAKSFRFAISTTENHQTGDGVLLGTPAYMAPEQLRGAEPSPTWDLWALGVVTFEMLTGTRPFVDTPPWLGPGFDTAEVADVLRSAPASWRGFFRRALATRPTERPSSAAQFAREFQQATLP